MEVIKLHEAGYDQAKYGFSLSYKDRAVDNVEWYNQITYAGPMVTKYDNVLKANASRDGGHNKFLEHIMVWLDIEANLEWWKQFDTYRIGTSKQSESTMHTLDKRDIQLPDLDLSDIDMKHLYPDEDDVVLLGYLKMINKMPSRLKSKLLPQGYKQRREVVLSYKVLRHIINQRQGHKLPEWEYFIEEIYRQLDYPGLLPDLKRFSEGVE